MINEKRRVLLIPVLKGWAFDHRAKDLLSLNLENPHLDLKYLNQINNSDLEKYDIFYAMSLSIATKLIKKGIPTDKITAGITSLRQLRKHVKKNRTFKQPFINFLKSLRAVNSGSDEIVHLFKPYHKVYKTRGGIDEKLFKPAAIPIRNDVFTVGWVGRIDYDRDLKGYDIVLTALKDLNVKLKIRTFTENYVPRDQMVNFYQGLDCFICSSESEVFSLPVLEAAACGIPIISTKVGIVPELITPNENGIIVGRNVEDIRKAIQDLIDQPKKRKDMGHKARQTILNHWTWKDCGKEWADFFKRI